MHPTRAATTSVGMMTGTGRITENPATAASTSATVRVGRGQGRDFLVGNSLPRDRHARQRVRERVRRREPVELGFGRQQHPVTEDWNGETDDVVGHDVRTA